MIASQEKNVLKEVRKWRNILNYFVNLINSLKWLFVFRWKYKLNQIHMLKNYNIARKESTIRTKNVKKDTN